jgi:hypothetical protein
MHDQGIFKRFLEVNEHPKEIADVVREVDEATKIFHVGILNCGCHLRLTLASSSS